MLKAVICWFVGHENSLVRKITETSLGAAGVLVRKSWYLECKRCGKAIPGGNCSASALAD